MAFGVARLADSALWGVWIAWLMRLVAIHCPLKLSRLICRVYGYCVPFAHIHPHSFASPPHIRASSVSSWTSARNTRCVGGSPFPVHVPPVRPPSDAHRRLSEPPRHPARRHAGVSDGPRRLAGAGVARPVCHGRVDRLARCVSAAGASAPAFALARARVSRPKTLMQRPRRQLPSSAPAAGWATR